MTVCKRIALFACIAISLLIFLPGASEAAPVGAFTRVEGMVDIQRTGQTAASPVRTGDPVSLGDAVRTLRGGRAEIRFRDETVLQLAQESRISIDEYSFSGGETRASGRLSLFRGKLRAVVSKVKASVVPASLTDTGFSIKTPTAIAGVRGTDFIVYYQRGVTGVIFLQGAGFVYNPERPGKVVMIHGGQAAFVPGAGAAPTNAQPVSGSFIAPHLKDTTVSLTNSERGGASDSTVREGALVTVAAANMTPEAISSSLGTEGRLEQYQQEAVRGPLVQLPMAPEIPPPLTRPPTDTTPALIKTPVTVNVKLP
jgi:hypothetical protein